MRENLKKKAQAAPDSPGVYLFKSGEEIIYIGKAKSIRKRLLQHLQAKEGKSVFIVQEADDIDYIITRSEKEALILEANMIFHYKPKYNTLLKSTEVYPYIKISKGDYPYVEMVRRKGKDGEYYGPFTSVGFVRDLLDALQRFLKFRTCKKKLERIKRPCMDYHIGRCVAPCVPGKVSVEEYGQIIEKLRRFLKGEIQEFVQDIRNKMEHHAKMLDFENAAKYRDILMRMKEMLQRQGVNLPDGRNLDVVVGEDGIFVVLRIRGGFLLGKLAYEMEGAGLEEFVEMFYAREGDIPGRVVSTRPMLTGITPVVEAADEAEKALLDMALRNLEEEKRKRGMRKEMLKRLAEFVGLKEIRRIEGIDISHLMGKGTVASVVVFVDGRPEKSEYRRYKVQLGKPDDYRAIKEVVKRRYSKHPVPDLLFVDGGIGQVKAAIHGLKLVGKSCKVVGLAKSEERVVKEDGEYRLPLDSPVVRALVMVRDEAHRFAVEGNRMLRRRESLRSLLQEIEGIGPVRRKKLLERFKDIEEIRNAPLEELAKVLGSRKVAQRLKESI